MALVIDEAQSLVIVEAPQATVFVRDLWTAIQFYLGEPGGLHVPNFVTIVGDQFVSDDGSQVTRTGLTLVVFQPWLIQFDARAGPAEEAMLVTGGSLIGDSGTIAVPNEDGTNPISPTAFTQVTIAQSPSPTLDNLVRLEKIARNKLVTDPVAGTLTIFDDDGVTPLLVAPLFEDVAGATPYQGKGANRRDRLI